MGWVIQGLNPGGSKIFSFSSTQPDYLWVLLSLFYNVYQGFFCGAKWPGRGVDRPSTSGTKVENG